MLLESIGNTLPSTIVSPDGLMLLEVSGVAVETIGSSFTKASNKASDVTAVSSVLGVVLESSKLLPGVGLLSSLGGVVMSSSEIAEGVVMSSSEIAEGVVMTSSNLLEGVELLSSKLLVGFVMIVSVLVEKDSVNTSTVVEESTETLGAVEVMMSSNIGWLLPEDAVVLSYDTSLKPEVGTLGSVLAPYE